MSFKPPTAAAASEIDAVAVGCIRPRLFAISALALLTLAVCILVAKAQPVLGRLDGRLAEADGRIVEKHILDGTPLRGFLTHVEVGLKGCILTRVSRFDRTCGTSFDSSKIVKKTEIIDFSEIPYPTISDVISGMVFGSVLSEHHGRRYYYRSLRRLEVCTGKIYNEDNTPFMIEGIGERRSDINRKYDFIIYYIKKYCR